MRPPYKGKPSFILDIHLGKLVRYLRRFNFDSTYQNDCRDKEIVDIALKENMIILTRDKGVLKRSERGLFM
ncbi:MAG: Mut7-C RNAse domain-containing protein [bacterium]